MNTQSPYLNVAVITPPPTTDYKAVAYLAASNRAGDILMDLFEDTL